MYCPRCGSPNPDTTKFCRQCGLGLQQVTGYVASGGTAKLQHPPLQYSQPTSSGPLAHVTEGLSPKQKLVLTILLIAFSPAILGVIGGVTGLGRLFGPLAGLSGVLTPIGIVWAIMYYKAQKRRLEQAQRMMHPPLHPPLQTMPPTNPYSLPQPPMQQAMQQPVSPTQRQQPVYQPPQTSAPPPTNPLKAPGSVIEDETRRLQ